jgi:hypothetical protein
MDKQKSGIELIAQEREEQLNKHQISIEKDINNHKDNQLLGVATALCLPDYEQEDLDVYELEEFCPCSFDKKQFIGLTKKPLEKRLVIAGALIAAEIDRLQNK